MRLAFAGSRRARAAGLGVLAATAALGVAVVGPGAQASSDYRVDVIFDTAKGIIPGQLVKIAGARAGLVKDVVLTPDYKARIQMTVDSRFAPFKSNARCEIQSEALIAERFVQCDPGTAEGRPLTGKGGQAPTVPVSHTFVPVAFTDLFNIWRLPVRQRLSIVIASLGLGLAGRGDDLNDLLRRANPTLSLVRQAIAILNRQRTELSAAIVTTDRVVADLAKRSDRVASFIEHAARVSKQTGDHSTELAQAVRRLPALLDATKPTLERLDALAVNGGPVLADLRRSAPGLQRLVAQVEPFSKAGVPALTDLGSATAFARSEVRRLRPVARLLRVFGREGLPVGKLVEELFVSLRDRGFVEGLLNFAYSVTASSARYDAISHILPERAIFNECSVFATAPVASCNANYGGVAGSTTTGANRTAPAHRIPRRESSAPETAAPPAPPASRAPPAIRIPGLPPIHLPSLPRTPKLGGGDLPSVPAPTHGRSPLEALFHYLLG